MPGPTGGCGQGSGFGLPEARASASAFCHATSRAGSEAQKAAPFAAQGISHHAEGKLDAIDAKAGTVSITHGPVPSLKWPGMTMDFMLANSGLIGNLKPGAAIEFTFVERKPGEWVIVKLEGTGASRPAAHSGH